MATSPRPETPRNSMSTGVDLFLGIGSRAFETTMKGYRHLRKGWQRSSQGPQHEQRQRHYQQDDREKDQRFGIAQEPHGGGPTARGISPAASIYTNWSASLTD